MTWSSAGLATSICLGMEINATPDLETRLSSQLLLQPCLSSYHQVRGMRKEGNLFGNISLRYNNRASHFPSYSAFLQWSSMAASLRWPAPCLLILSPPTRHPVTPHPAEISARQSACCAPRLPFIALERSTALLSGPSGSTLETVISTACIT